MLAFIVTLRSGRRSTIRAEELRFGNTGYVELWASPPSVEIEPFPPKQIVAMFCQHDVESVVVKEFLVSEEQCEPTPHVVRPSDQIPF